MSHSTTGKTPLPPLPMPDEIGPLVGRHVGGYEISGYLGEGPAGVVYRCEDLTGSSLVLKAIHRELSHPHAATALCAELARLREIGSRYITATLDTGFTDGGQFYCVTEELRGVDLADALADRGALPQRRAIEVIRQVCMAVEAAHAAGVIHGGLKPHNVFLARREDQNVGDWDHAEVLDFGASRLAGSDERSVIVGNPHYMAPEQFGGVADARSDVYAIGLLIHEIFSGAPPFAGTNSSAMMRHISESPAPLPGAPPELQKIILGALQKTPAARYATVRQLREAIERFAMATALNEAAAFHVVARASAARLAPASHPFVTDSTTPMQKVDVMKLAEASKRPGLLASSLPPDPPGTNGQNSDSVEASLEDFISQANKSFQEPADGWTLNTDEVELVTEADLQPVAPAKIAAALKAPPMITARESSKSLPVEAKQGKVGKTTKVGVPVTVPADRAATPPEGTAVPTASQLAAASSPTVIEADAPQLPAGGEALAFAATVSPIAAVSASAIAPVTDFPSLVTPIKTDLTPLPAPVPARVDTPAAVGLVALATAKSSPVMLVSVIFGAFLLGSIVMAVLIKVLFVPQAAPTPMLVAPVVMPTAPVVTAQPVTPTAPVVTPVVTPIGRTAPPVAATAPVVTPLPPAEPVVTALPPVAQPVVAAEPKKPHRPKAAVAASPAAAPAVKAKPAPIAAKEKPAPKVTAAPKEKPAPAVKPAPVAKPAKPAKEKGGDWVDPF